MSIEIAEKNGAVIFTVRVVPRASRSEIVGPLEGALKVRIASPPVDGAANDELVRLFAKLLSVPKSDVQIVSGNSSKTKTIRITGATAEQLRNALHLSEPKTA